MLHQNDISPGNVSLDNHDYESRYSGYVSALPVEAGRELIDDIPDFQTRKRQRCRALYDCNADNDDELDFKEGELIVIINERTDDENWMEGEVEGVNPRRGMFPVSFVQMLPD